MQSDQPAKHQSLVGIDIGGTKARVGIVDTQGQLIVSKQALIQAKKGPEYGMPIIQRLVESCLEATPDYQPFGIGIGCTGPLDIPRGLIQNPYTLPTWNDVPIVAELATHFSLPIRLENDADVAALGEYWVGAGQGAANLFAITVGTGIGTASILNGEIYRGLDGSHPDGGHIPIDPSGPRCYCGAYGCWESLASGSAIARLAIERMPNFPESSLWCLCQNNLVRLKAEMVTRAALEGDPLSLQILAKITQYFSLGVINVITLFVPEVIVLGGGVMRNWELFLPAISKAQEQHNVMVPARQVKIVPAQLGENAGIIGAAYAVYQQFILK